MATIITKNSSTASAAPASGDLTKGELAVNVTDKKLYTKDNSAAIVKIVGSLGNQEASAVAITGGSIAGITDLAVADGGTGASSAADARTNLGVTATGADTAYAFRSNNLSDLASASTARTNLGLGTIATQAASSVTITGGSVTGITDITVADGGTGASTAANARTNLGLVIGTDVLAPNGSAANLTSFPTLNQNTTGNAATVTTNANLTGAVTSVGNATSLGSFSSANLLAALTDETGTGSAVFATSPTLVTPILGTPTSATLTNATGLPISTGVSGLGTGVATALAVNVGSAGAPLVNGGVLGTPSSGTATNLTGLPISTGVSGLGTGVATALAVNVGSAGAPVVNGGALGTPSSGTATNLTGLPLSTGVTGTLPVANGGTGQTSYTDGQLLIGNSTGNTLTKATLTAGTNVTITNAAGAITIAATGGGGSGDVVGPASSTDNAFARFDSTTGKLLQNSTGATLSDTGGATFTGSVDVAGTSTAGSNIKLYEDTDNGTNYVSFKAPDTIAANVTWTLPSADGTSSQVLSTNGTGTLSWATVSGGASAATPTALGTVYGATSSGSPNSTFLGYQAGTSISGTYNTIAGYQAAFTTTTGASNTIYGAFAGYYVTGSNNSYFGYAAGSQNSAASGSNNVGIGHSALFANTTGIESTAVGYRALVANTTGDYNVAIGRDALRASTTAQRNTSVGSYSAVGITTGSYNTSVGFDAGAGITTGVENTFMGLTAGGSGNGSGIVGIGYQAGRGGGNYGVWIGYNAGQATNNSGTHNVGLGFYAGVSNSTGGSNTFIGYQTGGSNTTGSNNVFIGGEAGNATGAGMANTTASNNVGIGASALRSNTTGQYNTSIGYQSLYNKTTSSSNVALGGFAGVNVTTGNENLLLGYDAGTSGAPGGSITTQSNYIVVGSGRMTNAYIQIAWTVTSDARDKTDVVDARYGLNFVNELRPVEYKWDKRLRYENKNPDGTHKESKSQLGFLAQDVIALEKKYGATAKDLLIADDQCDDLFSITETKMIPVLVKAIQELKAEFDAYKATHP